MTILVGLFAAAAAIAWVMAIVTVIRLSRRLSGRLSLGAMAMRGMAWFDARNFQPDAAPLFRTLRLAFAGFFACVLAIAIVATLMAGRT